MFSQASFFTEIREVVRQEDLIRFDRLVFGRKGNLFDLLLADASSVISQPPNPTSTPALLSQVYILHTYYICKPNCFKAVILGLHFKPTSSFWNGKPNGTLS